MFSKLKIFIITLSVSLGSVLVLLPATSQAALFSGAKSQACSGISLHDNTPCDSASGTTLSDILKVALNILSIVVGIIAVVMIIVGGIKYALSQGESNNTNSARNTIIYAIVGMVIVALAQIIVRFVFNNISK